MPRKVPCSVCGDLRQIGTKGSLPEGQLTCHACRRKNRDPDRKRRYSAEYYLRNKARKRDRDHRARARRFGVECEMVIDLQVFERDKWRCGLCGERVNKRLTAPHILSASLDHVVPMSKGGGHTYANTQCAHWICNVLKCDKSGGEQLAIIG